MSVAVVQTVADETNTKPMDLPEVLDDVIDPDALDRLFQDREVDGHVNFQFCDYDVTVYSDGAVDIRSLTAP